MLTVIRKLLDLLSPRGRVQLLILLALLAITAILDAAAIAAIMPFMALVVSPETITTNSALAHLYVRLDLGSEAAFLTFVGASVLLLLVLSNGAKLVTGYLTMRYQHRQSYHVSRKLLESYMARPYAFFLGRNTSELGSAVLYHTSGAIERVLRQCIDVFSSSLVCIAITLLLLAVNPLVAVTMAAALTGSYLLVYLIIHRRLGQIAEQQVGTTAGMYRYAAEAMGGIKDLKLLGRERTYLEKFASSADRFSRNNSFTGVASALPRYVLETLAFGGILLAILYFINQGKEATQIVPILALYAFAGYRLLPALHSLFVAFTVIRYNISSLDLVHSELLTGPVAANGGNEVLQDRTNVVPAELNRELELHSVVYQYAEASEPSLRGLSLVIKPNTTIGLVGPTGCGKTTAVDVILGLLEPSQGRILLDGVEITAANRASWQSIIGYVPQTIYLADDTLANNIAFGIPADQVDMNAVRRAAAIANLAEFVESSLPQGYETHIGERGVRLSGGQRQRIGIARAMYRDPAVLVMDEATSALDGVTEEGVMSAINALSRQKTIILVAHRLSTIRACDVIYQLDRGAVQTSGTYQELMDNSKWFRTAAQGAEYSGG